ncbi:MAG: hypothetical protein DWP94_01785 [Flavobacterium sp.]|nr:MAG: hypothetical protein DWP94_01785 [Flavobacterium sp.]
MKRYLTYALAIIFMCGFHACKKDEGTAPPDGTTDDDNPPVGGNFEGVIEYVKTYGGSNEDEAVDVVQANDGGYVMVGTTSSNDGDITDKTTTDPDYWVLKVNAAGEKQWSKTYGGTSPDRATGIVKTTDGGYILSGHSRSNDGDVGGNEGFHDYWIVKINSVGDIQWETNFGFSGSDQALNIIQTSDGGYFATGFLDVSASGGMGNDGRNPEHGVGEYWGIKMDANGNKIWRRYFGGSNNDRSYDVVQTDDGGFLMIGASESDDFDKLDPKGSYDFWVVKVSAGGDNVWSKSFGGSEIDVAYGVTQTTDGNYMIVGDTRSTDQDVTNPLGNADLWVVKFNKNNGAIIWQKTYGGTEFESARSVERLPNGTYLISGSTRSANGDVSMNIGQNDAWVLIINENGELQYQKTAGGTSLDFAEGAIQTTDNKLIVVGNTESNDIDITVNRGIKDLLLIKVK